MGKKGFTLVELLAVIAILAVLVIIVLPNIISLFNQVKKNSFENELKNIFKITEQEWILDSMFDTQNIVYARNKNEDCPKELSLSGRKEIDYYIEVDKTGKVIKYFATDGTHQYEYIGEELKIEEIGNSTLVAALENKDVLTITCAGAIKNGEIILIEPIEGDNAGEDCSGNPVANTIPSNATGLYKIMAEQAYLDNVNSPNVTSCSGVDFNAISSDSNGKGIYEMASTKDDAYPIYYYRGDVNNNNVKFGGFCWKAVRTTATGGVKLIYNGAPDVSGHCTNTTGEATQIGAGKFNNNGSPAHVGYMYGTKNGATDGSAYSCSNKTLSTSDAGIKFGESVTYSDGTYTLTNTIDLTSSNYNQPTAFNNHHYTCFSTSKTCSTVYYVYHIAKYNLSYYYVPISGVNPNGRELIDVVKETMFRNDKDSKVKIEIDAWYRDNMTSYTSLLEDTVYCNDRSILSDAGWSTTGSMDKWLHFAGYTRTYNTFMPSLTCERTLDKFTVSSKIGNGKLIYPVGLLTADEIMLAGGKESINNSTYYLYTNQAYWSGSPLYFSGRSAYEINVNSNGYISDKYVSDNYGIRPVVTLSKKTSVISGDGSSNNPYVIG